MPNGRRHRVRSGGGRRCHELYWTWSQSLHTLSAVITLTSFGTVPFARCPMTDLTLYHAVPSRSSVVLWMLEELGQPYDLKLLSLKQGDNLKPDYLAINPMGKV